MKAPAIQAAILLGQSASAAQAAPLQYLSGAGDKATPVVALTWGVLLISVVVIFSLRCCWRPRSGAGDPIVVESTALEKDEGGQNWLWIGVGLSALVLLVTVVWTVKVLADIQAPRYQARRHHRNHRQAMVVAGPLYRRRTVAGFTTANEIHIPAGAAGAAEA